MSDPARELSPNGPASWGESASGVPLGAATSTGTPLGRIVLGVFLALSVLLVVVVLPIFLLTKGADQMIDNEREKILSRVEETPLGSPNTGLSDACRKAIDKGDRNVELACKDDSAADLEEYASSLG